MRHSQTIASLDKRDEAEVFRPPQDAPEALWESQPEHGCAICVVGAGDDAFFQASQRFSSLCEKETKTNGLRIGLSACDPEGLREAGPRTPRAARRPVEEASTRASPASSGLHKKRERRLHQRTAEARVEPVCARLSGLPETKRNAGLIERCERPERSTIGDSRGLDRFDGDSLGRHRDRFVEIGRKYARREESGAVSNDHRTFAYGAHHAQRGPDCRR